MSFLGAFQFLTSVPLPWARRVSPEEMGRATAFFPLVGLIIGLVLAGLNLLLSIFLPPAVVTVLLLLALVILTGAMHLDGFIDTCDGIGGHKTAEERWSVMRDSRAGAFGIVGAVMLLLLKYVALGSIPAGLITPALIFMPVVSRWAMVYVIFVYPYARPSGLGSEFKKATRWPRFVVATLTTLLVAVALIPVFRLSGLIIILVIWIIVMAVAAYFRSRFAGLTGDNYGAVSEIAEVSTLLVVILLAGIGLA